jgi:hypothetical protein
MVHVNEMVCENVPETLAEAIQEEMAVAEHPEFHFDKTRR